LSSRRPAHRAGLGALPPTRQTPWASSSTASALCALLPAQRAPVHLGRAPFVQLFFEVRRPFGSNLLCPGSVILVSMAELRLDFTSVERRSRMGHSPPLYAHQARTKKTRGRACAFPLPWRGPHKASLCQRRVVEKPARGRGLPRARVAITPICSRAPWARGQRRTTAARAPPGHASSNC